MTPTPTEQPRGRAWSEDPGGLQLQQIRVEFDDPTLEPIALPRRGPIRFTEYHHAHLLTELREHILAAERTLAGPVDLHWHRTDADDVEIDDAQLIDTPLSWGAAPGHGYSDPPHPNDRWSRANAGEIMPNVISPLSWSVIAESLDRGFQVPWREATDWTEGRRFVACFDGYVYFNVGLILELIGERSGLPTANFLEMLGGPEDASLGTTAMHWPTILRRAPFLLKSAREQRATPRRWPKQRAETEAERDRLRALNADELSDTALLREVTLSNQAVDSMVVYLMQAQTAVYSAVQTLLWILDGWLGPSVRPQALSILQGMPGIRTQDGNIALRRVAERAAHNPHATEFIRQHDADTIWPALQSADLADSLTELRDDLGAFLNEYGHRAAGELEAAEPRWVEQPALILGTFRDYVLQPDPESTDDLLARQREQREAAEQEIEARFGRSPIGRLRWTIIRSLIRQAQSLQPLRENPKFSLLEVSLQQRRLWRVLAQRWQDRDLLDDLDEIYYLTLDELTTLARRSSEPLIANRMRSRVRRRRTQFNEWIQQPPPPLRDHLGQPIAQPDQRTTPTESEPDSEPQVADSAPALPRAMTGIAASAGLAEGIAHVADSAAQGRQLEPGQILVARFTDPGWTPIFPLAAAVVTEIGGVLSHGAIVAREFGIPAVVNVRSVTKEIQTGDQIQVDGTKGQVTIIKRPT